MSYVHKCDICKEDIPESVNSFYVRAELNFFKKFRYSNSERLDVCCECMQKFEEFVKQEAKETT